MILESCPHKENWAEYFNHHELQMKGKENFRNQRDSKQISAKVAKAVLNSETMKKTVREKW